MSILPKIGLMLVALRKESVDRNGLSFARKIRLVAVALRKESVDRNVAGNWRLAMNLLSLSARRAWIEIINNNYQDLTRPVALRKESVDRNLIGCINRTVNIMSLSARRAWIEI